jgi:hypothetical protein
VQGETPKRRGSALLGWWYLSIGAGFFLLGLNRLVVGDALWGVLLRWLIAGGFLVLGGWELRSGPARRP